MKKSSNSDISFLSENQDIPAEWKLHLFVLIVFNNFENIIKTVKKTL